MSSPIQVRTQDNVLAAEIRSALNNGPEWGTAGSTLATTSDLNALAGGADLPTTVAKVNVILSLLRNLNA